jgi:hypothetical protein
MSTPKGFQKNIDIVTPKNILRDRVSETTNDIFEKNLYQIKGVMPKDIDKSFTDFIDKLDFTLNGKKVPVIFLTIQKWVEFTKTWTFTDEKYSDLSMPFITIIRNPNIEQGTGQGGNFNPANKNFYATMKVPTWDGNRKGYDIYKIPLPTQIDVTYEVRLFCNRMTDLNPFHYLLHNTYNSIQQYIFPNNHAMPTKIESISDESQLEDIEKRKFYVQTFTILLQGYVSDPKDYIVEPAITRKITITELSEQVFKPTLTIRADENKNVRYKIVFKDDSETTFRILVRENLVFKEILDIKNLSNILISINGDIVVNGLNITTPFNVQANTYLDITIQRVSGGNSVFSLFGELI